MSFERRRESRRDNFESGHDEEVNKFNRLFVMGAKGATEQEFKEAFGEYGKVEDVKCVTDRNTGESRGITYIRFSKASEACQALEEMNGKSLLHYPKPMKVVMASPRKEGNVREENEHEKLQRLFIMIPTSYDKAKVEEIFKEWGDIEYVNVLKHRDTGKAKGLAYVKYFRPYHAALALENCDRSYKALFADTTRQKPKSQSFNYSDDNYGGRSDYGSASSYSTSYPLSHVSSTRNIRYGDPSTLSSTYSSGTRGSLLDTPSLGRYSDKSQSFYDNYCQPSAQPSSGISVSNGGPSPLSLMSKVPHNDCTTLSFLGSPQASEQQMYEIFNIVPGFEKIQYNEASATGKVVFQSPQCAAWAQNKINGFEFPPGFRMQVTFDQNASKSVAQPAESLLTEAISAAAMNLQSGGDVQSSIQQIAAAMQAATGNNASLGGDMERLAFCSVPLPLPKPWAQKSSQCAERLFFVSQPDSFPEKYLRDVFGRFAGLQEVYFIPRKNFGYAKYGNKESAVKAVEVLHGSYICDMRMKVMVAEPESNPGKRDRSGYDDQTEEKRFRRE